MGFILSGIVDRKQYVMSRVNFLLFGCFFILILNLIIFFVSRLPVFKVLPFYSLYFMGTLPYLYCWLRIKAFKPSHPFDKNVMIHFNLNAKEEMIILLPVILIGTIYTIIVSSAIDVDTIFHLPFKYYLPLAGIGGLGLLFHQVWMDRLAKLFENKRFNIFEESESV